MAPKEDTNEAIMLCLGELKGMMSTQIDMSKSQAVQNQRVVWALLGVIGAMVGVKIVGSPVLLDIAVIFQSVGVFLTLGVLFRIAARHNDNYDLSFSRSGWLFVVLLSISLLVVVSSFFRETFNLDPNLVYILMVAWGVAQSVFAWFLFDDIKLFKKKKTTVEESACYSGEGELNG